MIRKKYNPESSATNTLQLSETDSGCCGPTLQVCKYAGNLAALVNLKSITMTSAREKIGAVTLALQPYTTISELKSQLLRLIESEGFLVDGVDAIKLTKKDDNTYDIAFTGEAEFVSYKDNVTTETFTKTCDRVLICEFKLIAGDGTAVPFEYGGVSTSLGDITYPSTTAGSLKTAIEGAATNAKSVKVTADAAAEAYVIVIKDYNDAEIKLAGKTAMKCCCVPDYE